ncbi:MAG: inositol monophosphatase family protein [Candidatus Wallbacteria bacterium]|nr:inositol monophosphatase family protein [Candidatus Wallbacteria bacterium]
MGNLFDLKKNIEMLKEIALSAGILLRKKFSENLVIGFKGSNNLVTDADLESETMIVEFLRKNFPSHGIIAEEGSKSESQNAEYFLIDPLDGTTNFAHSYPCFAVSIGLMENEEPVCGVVYDPMRDEMFSAFQGGGALLNGNPLKVSGTAEVGKSLLVTGFAYDSGKFNNLPHFSRIVLEAQGVRRDGSAALDICHVAAGRFDGFWEMGLYPWDTAAGAVILSESGGRISRFDLSPWHPAQRELLATNGKIHAELSGLLTCDGK